MVGQKFFCDDVDVNPYAGPQDVTKEAMTYLTRCSRPYGVRVADEVEGDALQGKPPKVAFSCKIFNSPWDQFVELWAPRIFYFVGNALGEYGTEPLPEILKMTDAEHTAGATASFEPSTGQVRLASSVEGKPGQTLEKLTHEFTHGSLSRFPEGDPFYEEGFVDYSVWVMAHAPFWEPYRESMIEAAAFNIAMRRERAMMDMSDWDRKRWAGGLYASLSRGPLVIASLRHRKMENTFLW